MNENEKNELIIYRISRAKETLKEVEAMIKDSFWNAAVNRLYYSCFYGVSAILLKYNIEVKTHAGVRQMFGLHLIQRGKISMESGKFYSRLFDKRQIGDYDDFIIHTKETLDELFPLGIKLIEEIEQVIAFSEDRENFKQ